MPNLITRGLGPSAGEAGREGPVTQGFGGVAAVAPVTIQNEDYRWVELSRLRSVEGTNPMQVGSVRTVDVMASHLDGTRVIEAAPKQFVSTREVPVARSNSGNAVARKIRAIRKKR